MKERKKYWLIPIFTIMFLFGWLIVMTEGSVVAPFIYTLFQTMYILGISAFYHDSAAALIYNGKIIAAAQEERFTRKKNDSRFPKNAIKYCFETANITPKKIDHIAFYDKPFIKFERL